MQGQVNFSVEARAGLMTKESAADSIGVDVGVVDGWIRRGYLPSVQVEHVYQNNNDRFVRTAIADYRGHENMGNRKRWNRFSAGSIYEGVEDAKGGLFLSPLGQENLSGVHVLHQGVDTIRQLYQGVPDEHAALAVQTAYEAGFKEVVELAGAQWLVGHGGRSGYRFRLQNSEWGVIVFFGSKYRGMEIGRASCRERVYCEV